MIPITLSWFVCLYLGVFLVGMILLWTGYEVIRRRSDGISNQELVHCRICDSRYSDISTAELPQCPACGSLNERPSKRSS